MLSLVSLQLFDAKIVHMSLFRYIKHYCKTSACHVWGGEERMVKEGWLEECGSEEDEDQEEAN